MTQCSVPRGNALCRGATLYAVGRHSVPWGDDAPQLRQRSGLGDRSLLPPPLPPPHVCPPCPPLPPRRQLQRSLPAAEPLPANATSPSACSPSLLRHRHLPQRGGVGAGGGQRCHRSVAVAVPRPPPRSALSPSALGAAVKWGPFCDQRRPAECRLPKALRAVWKHRGWSAGPLAVQRIAITSAQKLAGGSAPSMLLSEL